MRNLNFLRHQLNWTNIYNNIGIEVGLGEQLILTTPKFKNIECHVHHVDVPQKESWNECHEQGDHGQLGMEEDDDIFKTGRYNIVQYLMCPRTKNVSATFD